MSNTNTSLQPLFYPKSVAVIGASQDAKKIAGRSLKNLLAYGYQGTVHAATKLGVSMS